MGFGNDFVGLHRFDHADSIVSLHFLELFGKNDVFEDLLTLETANTCQPEDDFVLLNSSSPLLFQDRLV